MSRRARRRRKAKRRAKRKSFGLSIVDLEIAKGHDGLLRGAPEPTILVAAYAVAGPKQVTLAGRGIFRFTVPEKIPACVQRREGRLEGFLPRWHNTRMVYLFVAMEEDAGHAISEVFAFFERSEDLVIVTENAEQARGHHLEDFMALPDAMLGKSQLATLTLDSQNLALLPGDDWISARVVVWTLPFSHQDPMRLHFRSSDGKNDWTLRLKARA